MSAATAPPTRQGSGNGNVRRPSASNDAKGFLEIGLGVVLASSSRCRSGCGIRDGTLCNSVRRGVAVHERRRARDRTQNLHDQREVRCPVDSMAEPGSRICATAVYRDCWHVGARPTQARLAFLIRGKYSLDSIQRPDNLTHPGFKQSHRLLPEFPSNTRSGRLQVDSQRLCQVGSNRHVQRTA